MAGALERLGVRVVAGGLLADDGAGELVCIVEVGAGVDDVVGVAAAWVAAL